MSKGFVNTFDGDMNLDIDKEVLPVGMVRESWNSRILDKEGTSYSRSRMPGTEEIPGFQLTEGYQPLATEDFGGILVVVSQKGNITEIGTYPSPDYTLLGYGTGEVLGSQTKLEYKYRPLMNLYNGDKNNKAMATEFRTTVFGYTEDTEVSIELQQDYDKSLNIVLTAKGKTPVIINTGFSVFPDNSFIIEERNDGSSTNRYTVEDLKEFSNLFVKSSTMPSLYFEGVEDGGAVKAGNYRFYFRYLNQDGNETDIIAHSLQCSVFHGNSFGNVKGGKHNETTNKRISFRLGGLNVNYQSLSVYFAYSSGESGDTTQFFRLSNPVQIIGSNMHFTFSGIAEVTPVSIEEAGAIYSTISTADCSAQIDSRLLLANTTEEMVELKHFKTLSQAFIPSIYEESLDIPLISSPGTIYSVDAVGYRDPENVYHRLSCHSEEAYPYAVVYVLKNGSHTPAFPVRGLILGDTQRASYNTITAADYNDKGIIRFPQRESMEAGAKAMGVEFQLTIENEEQQAALEEVRKQSTGYFFVRGELMQGWRDILAQGYLINTVLVPRSRGYDIPMNADWTDGKLNSAALAAVPAVDFQIESHSAKRNSSQETEYDAVMTFRQHPPNSGDRYEFLRESSQTRYAFISNDLSTDPEGFRTRLNSSSLYVQSVKKVSLRPVVNRKGDGSVVLAGDGNDILSYASIAGGYNTLYVPFKESDAAGEFIEASGYFVDTAGMSQDFGGVAHFKSYVGMYPVEQASHFRFHARYNAYMGIALVAQKELAASIVSEDSSRYVFGQPAEIGSDTYAQLINIRTSNAITTRNAILNTRYQTLDSVRYMPATHIGSTQLLRNSQRMKVFGGDTYLDWGFRRLYYTGDKEYSSKVGQTIALFHESLVNPALRAEVETSSNENIDAFQTFFPVAASNIHPGGGDRYGTGDPWRENNDGAESSYFNKGYEGGEKVLISRPLPSNFIETGKASYTRPTRIYVSEQYVTNQFENSYRNFRGINYKDYDFQYGEIVQMYPKGDTIVLIQERGIGVLPINQRIQVGSDAGGSIYTEAASFLPPKALMISKQVGAQHKSATLCTDNFVYGVDVLHKKIWREEGNRVRILSDNRISSYLREHLDSSTRVSIGWDRDSGDIYFTFFQQERNFTVLYNENQDKFLCFTELCSRTYGYLLDRMLSFNQGSFHWHGKGTPGSFYGTHHPTRITFMVNEALDAEKVFDFFNILSNECPPTRIEFKTDKLQSVLEVGFDDFLEDLNVKYRGSKFVGSIEKNENLWAEDPLLGEGSDTRIRDRVLEVTLVYEGEQQLSLNGFVTYYRRSVS